MIDILCFLLYINSADQNFTCKEWYRMLGTKNLEVNLI